MRPPDGNNAILRYPTRYHHRTCSSLAHVRVLVSSSRFDFHYTTCTMIESSLIVRAYLPHNDQLRRTSQQGDAAFDATSTLSYVETIDGGKSTNGGASMRSIGMQRSRILSSQFGEFLLQSSHTKRIESSCNNTHAQTTHFSVESRTASRRTEEKQIRNNSRLSHRVHLANFFVTIIESENDPSVNHVDQSLPNLEGKDRDEN